MAFYSIFYQGSVYPAEDFETVKEFGLFLIKARNQTLLSYMNRLIDQLNNWISIDGIHEIVLVIKDQSTQQTLERWQFKIDLEGENNLGKEADEIEKEIRALMRHITSVFTFLPLSESKKCFDVVVYVREEVVLSNLETIRKTWNDSEQFLIASGGSVALRNFSTKLHSVNTSVTYRLTE